MAKKNKKSVQICIYLGILIIIILISYFLIYPLVLDIQKQRGEVLATKEILKQKKAAVEKFGEVAEKYQSLSSETQKLDKIISSDANLPRLLLQLETLAMNNGMIMEDVSFGIVKSGKGGIGTVPINLKVLGSYNSFKNYLEAVSKSLPLIDIETINFSSKDREEEIYSFSLTINTYGGEMPAAPGEEEEKEETD